MKKRDRRITPTSTSLAAGGDSSPSKGGGLLTMLKIKRNFMHERNYFKLDDVVTLLQLSIAFVCCNEQVLCNEAYKEIKQKIPNNIIVENIKMDENSFDLLLLLRNETGSESHISKIRNNKLVFFVFGIDNAIKNKNPDGISKALFILNIMREEFLKIKNTIVIWADAKTLSLIMKEAPDFFSWRTTVFDIDCF